MSKHKSTALALAALVVFVSGLWISPAWGSGGGGPQTGYLKAFCFTLKPVTIYYDYRSQGRPEVAAAYLAQQLRDGECMLLEAPIRVTLDHVVQSVGGSDATDIWSAQWRGWTIYAPIRVGGERT